MQEQETRGFQSEVKQLMHLMSHFLYSNKEVFLRELISNASDAADKLRFRALSNLDLYENDVELHVRISFDKEKRILIVSDNGIGMNRSEVIENLGTIAKSGTKSFLESINSNTFKNNQLIGQFGVGFYSVFIVAEKVIIQTRAAGDKPENGVLWESDGKGEYTISNINKQHRGTDVFIYLKKGEEDFLNDWKVRAIINKYSTHIELPVEIKKQEKKGEDVYPWEKINKAQALWTRNKSEIKDEEYQEFYQYITHDQKKPLMWSHNRVEGKQEYISLLYIPSQLSSNIWNNENKTGLKLYINRVFIMEDNEQFIPRYLRFIRGLIDSKDLPLNVSREILQNNNVICNMRNALTKRTLQMLNKLAKDEKKFQIFWKQFGLIFKEGLVEDTLNHSIITQLLRFSSTNSDFSEKTISLDQYVSRMQSGQEKIYYLIADTYIAAKNSPHLEIFRNKNIEVLLLYDRIDGWIMNYLTEFKGKSFQSINTIDESKEKLINNLNNDNKETEQNPKKLESFILRVKTLLGNRVKDIRYTYRLTDTPAIVTVGKDEISTQMEKLFVATGQSIPEIKYIFELNPKHPIVKHVMEIKEENLFKEWIELLLEQSLLSERGSLEDLNLFIKRTNQLLLNK